MKKIKYLCFLLCLVCFPFSVSAESYDITNYYMDVVVNENNIYNVSEYYNVMFNEEDNFVRTISLRPEIYLSNEKFITYITEVENANASENFTTKQNSKNYELKISTPYKDLGTTISLSYEYNMGHDLDDDYDIVFINLIDGTFAPITDEILFALTLPTTVEKENVSFYINGKKVHEEETIIYDVKDNYIEGILRYDFNSKDKIGIQVALPNGTFKNTTSTENTTNYLLLILPIITFVMSLILRKKYKKQTPQMVEDVLAISNNLDSLEMAYLYNGKINTVDLISLIFKLANDGYVSFKNYGSKDNVLFKIRKIREYDKDNAAQKIVFDGLFQNREEIDIKDIDGVFYPYYIDARRTLENNKNKNKLFYGYAKKLKDTVLIGTYIGLVLLQMNPLYNLLDSNVFALILASILSMICVISFKYKNKILKYGLPMISILIVLVEIYALLDFRINLVIYVVGVILLTGALLIESLIPTRTGYGSQMHYEIDAFKLELTGMSNETFDAKMQTNPNYFFEMIPYTIIFGLNSWWFNRFGGKIKDAPSWYESSEVYTEEKILEFIEQTIYQLTVSMQVNRMHTDELLNQAPNKLL